MTYQWDQTAAAMLVKLLGSWQGWAWLTTPSPGLRILEAAVFLQAILAPVLPHNTKKTLAAFTVLFLILVGFVDYIDRQHPAWPAIAGPVLVYLVALTAATWKCRHWIRATFPNPWRGDCYILSVAFVATAIAASQIPPSDRQALVFAIIVAAALVSLFAIAQRDRSTLIVWQGRRVRIGSYEPGHLMATRKWLLRGRTKRIAIDFARFKAWSFRIQGVASVNFWGRVPGTLANPVLFAGYLCLALPLAVGQALAAPSWWLILASGCIAAALIQTGSRAAWISSLIVVGWMLVSRASPVMLAAVAMSGAGGTWLGWTGVRKRLHDLWHDTSWGGRAYVWGQTIARVRSKPWFGWGHNMLAVPADDDSNDQWDHPHNEAVGVVYTSGVVGLVAYLAAWGVAIFGHPPAGVIPALLCYGIWLQSGWNHLGSGNCFWPLLGLASG